MNAKYSKYIHRLTAALAGASMLATLSACGGNTGTGQTPEAMEIKYGSTPGNQEYLPFWVAEEQGFFDDHGITAKPVSVDSGPASNTLLIGGSLDVSLLPVSSVFQDWQNNKKVHIVSGSKTQLGVALLGRADDNFDLKASPTARLKAMKGKKIAVPARGSLIELQVSEALKSVGLDPARDVAFVAVASRPDTLSGALKTGAVDLLATTGVRKVSFVESGLAQIVLQLGDVEGQQPGADMVVGVTDKTLAQHPDEVEKVHAALADSIKWMKDPANTEALADIFAKYSPTGQDQSAEFKRMWAPNGLDEAGLYTPGVSEQNYAEAARFASATDPNLKSPSYEDVVYEPTRG